MWELMLRQLYVGAQTISFPLLLVEVVGADRVRQLPEVHLEERGDGVDVGEHGAVGVQVRHAVLVERHPVRR